MKYCDKYPPPDEGEPCLPPPSKFCGLHPLVWIFLIVMAFAVFGAADHLEDADWDRLPVFDDDDFDDSEVEDDSDEPQDKPSS